MSNDTLTREEIERLLAEATPEPWRPTLPPAYGICHIESVTRGCLTATNAKEADARLIAAAPTIARMYLATAPRPAGEGEVEGLIGEAATAIWNHLCGSATETGTAREVIERHIKRLVARQQAEIARLHRENEVLAAADQKLLGDCQRHIEEQDAEIASLREQLVKEPKSEK